VTIAVSRGAAIDGSAHAAGAVVLLKAGRHEVEVAGHKQFVDLRAACSLRDHVGEDGALRVDCFP
jgi:hypothetical protein